MAEQNGETRDYEIGGIRLAISDSAGSQAAGWIANEMATDEYRLGRIPFDPGDVVIDVGRMSASSRSIWPRGTR